jgi:hypothetical protein
VRCVFLHIPRCAGSTIHFHFKANHGSQKSGRVVLFDTWDAILETERIRAARAATFVSGHFGWRTLEKAADGALRFAALREPFARLRSLYRFCRQLAPEDAARHAGFAALAGSAQSRCFEDFCLDGNPSVRAMIDNMQARTLAWDYFPLKEEPADTVVGTAKRHLDSLDLVWDADRLDEVLPQIAQRTRTTIIRKKTALNRSRPCTQPTITRAEFLKDARLSALVALDMEVFEYARSRWSPS